jgi:hypothetical protein
MIARYLVQIRKEGDRAYLANTEWCIKFANEHIHELRNELEGMDTLTEKELVRDLQNYEYAWRGKVLTKEVFDASRFHDLFKSGLCELRIEDFPPPVEEVKLKFAHARSSIQMVGHSNMIFETPDEFKERPADEENTFMAGFEEAACLYQPVMEDMTSLTRDVMEASIRKRFENEIPGLVQHYQKNGFEDSKYAETLVIRDIVHALGHESLENAVTMTLSVLKKKGYMKDMNEDEEELVRLYAYDAATFI